MKALFVSLLLFSTTGILAQEPPDPMTLELMDLRIDNPVDGNGDGTLFLSINIKNNTDTFYFIAESGFNIKLNVSGAGEHVFKYTIPSIKVQGLAVPPHGKLSLGNIKCGKLGFSLEKGILSVSYEICSDTDFSNMEKDREVYNAEIKSPSYAFETATQPFKGNPSPSKGLMLKPLAEKR